MVSSEVPRSFPSITPTRRLGRVNSALKVLITLAAAGASAPPETTAVWPAKSLSIAGRAASLRARLKRVFFTTFTAAPTFRRRPRSSENSATFIPV